MDEQHPNFSHDEKLALGIQTLYQQIDEALGAVLQAVDESTTVIVMSDHGFAPFNRGVNLNSWLLEKGYVKLKDPTKRGDPFFPERGLEWNSGLRLWPERSLRQFTRPREKRHCGARN